MTWQEMLRGDPLPWLLEPDPQNPAVRYFALRHLLDRPDDDPEVCRAGPPAPRWMKIGGLGRPIRLHLHLRCASA